MEISHENDGNWIQDGNDIPPPIEGSTMMQYLSKNGSVLAVDILMTHEI